MGARFRRHAVPSLALALLGGCGDQKTLSPCTPLASQPEPIALAAVLGVGQHADGAVYVVDQPSPGAERVFVSQPAEAVLVRQPIAGGGSGADWMTFSVTAATPPFTLKIELPAGGPVSMGVVRGSSPRDFEIGTQGDVLNVVSTDALAGKAVQNLPGETTTEYLASLEDGRRLVVLRPTNDWTYDDFRLFLGTPDAMAERQIVSVMRAKDGGTTTIVFQLDGARATALFPAPIRNESPTLMVGGTTTVLTLAAPGTSASAFAFTCRR